MTEYLYKDYKIESPGEEYEDFSGDVDVIEHGFICPICASVVGAIGKEGGIMGCDGCDTLWKRKDGKLVVFLDD